MTHEEKLLNLVADVKSDEVREVVTALIEWIKSKDEEPKITESEPEPEN